MAQKFFDNKDFLSPPNGDRLKIFFFLHCTLYCAFHILKMDGWLLWAQLWRMEKESKYTSHDKQGGLMVMRWFDDLKSLLYHLWQGM